MEEGEHAIWGKTQMERIDVLKFSREGNAYFLFLFNYPCKC